MKNIWHCRACGAFCDRDGKHLKVRSFRLLQALLAVERRPLDCQLCRDGLTRAAVVLASQQKNQKPACRAVAKRRRETRNQKPRRVERGWHGGMVVTGSHGRRQLPPSDWE